ncbi:MAG: 5'-methylthioadenosine/adenosylhomocysteine nucleosidase [Clostridia bacterium]|nr:5'-methylthioadenosine/adenosylhomocysteine nucleosidase [Clostridia bacterium]
MKIGIIGAMSEEVAQLKSEMSVEQELHKAQMDFYSGSLLNKDIVIVTSGIGKVNAAVCTQILVNEFHVDCVINVGIAGGLHKDIFPGDIVVAENLVQHDMDTTQFGYPIGQIPRMETFDFKCDDHLIDIAKKACDKVNDANCFSGRIVSGDQFIANAEKLESLHETFGGLCCEMEGASIGQVCYLNNVPFIVIRSISDNAINGTHMDYEKFSELAIKNSVAILKDMLQAM